MSHSNKGKKVTKRKKPRYILKVNVPPPPVAPAPIPSSSAVRRIYMPIQTILHLQPLLPHPRLMHPTLVHHLSLHQAPSPGATLPSVSSVPSPLPLVSPTLPSRSPALSPLSVPSRVRHTPAGEDQEVHIQQGDAQLDIEEDHPLGTNLPIISPYGLG
ncbi:unnamed protein product [Sphenostylis stenocarpa]|uniref:Uncharacterized protein n=1 Tax=Sphenostylis stenocarpa TaxID=92480 RepID=A0AA86VML3_9FABA|nr:unnamed protein product [Sphenostylis stenocarpa]